MLVNAFPPDDCTPPIVALPDTPTPPTLPRVTDLPARCRNEPAVLGCATGEVRRMRSVLDMKLGAMAVSLDAHLPEGDADAPAQPDGSAKEASVVVDVFGIAIPRSTQRKMQRDGCPEPVYRKCSDADSSSSIPSFKSDGACSVILAESPSRLDLSALLC